MASHRFLRRLTLLGTVVGLVAMAMPGSALAGSHRAGTCSNGTMLAGDYRDFVVTGTCTIAYGANVRIHGDLTVAAGASLDDHGAEQWMNAQVHVTGNVHVHRGAVLGLGWNSPEGSLADFRNFPVKDNVIHGNLVIAGWRGGWMGVIRNHVDRNVIVLNNVSRSNPETGPGMDPDSTEVQTNAISGNLVCFGNSPDAQVNSSDGGQPNAVGGHGIGECAALVP